MVNVRPSRRLAAATVAALLGFATLPAAYAHEEAKPGFNVFSVEQEVELGQQAAADAERQLPMLNDRSVEGYVNAIVRVLAREAPGPRFPYRARVVNAADINAFALPGGLIYVNRGLIQAARTEGELAGVLAHEMAHVGLRHGTHQVSKAYAAQLGLGVLGQILGGRDRRVSPVWQVLGGLGLNTLFLKFSRDAENQADSVGARMMAEAGYDPVEMANFFDLLHAQQRRNPSSVEQFFSSHPSPANRSAHIRAEARELGGGGGRLVGNLAAVQSRLDRMPAASRRAVLRTSRAR